jgi:hypothetical protein
MYVTEYYGTILGRTFMTRSGLTTLSPEIPIPALDVPNAAPTADNRQQAKLSMRLVPFGIWMRILTAKYHLQQTKMQ